MQSGSAAEAGAQLAGWLRARRRNARAQPGAGNGAAARKFAPAQRVRRKTPRWRSRRDEYNLVPPANRARSSTPEEENAAAAQETPPLSFGMFKEVMAEQRKEAAKQRKEEMKHIAGALHKMPVGIVDTTAMCKDHSMHLCTLVQETKELKE